jgi:hypothetical protein
MDYISIKKTIVRKKNSRDKYEWWLCECLNPRENTGERNILSDKSEDDVIDQLKLVSKYKLDKEFKEKYD